MITFLVGGARSGKSSLAVEIGSRHEAVGGAVVFVATAEAFDDDLRARIDLHRIERPAWPTVEAPVDLAGALASVPADSLAIIDCLTVWVGNLFHHVPDTMARIAAYGALVDSVAGRSAPTVLVSNEVGLGLHPDTASAREYRDELGRLNQRVAGLADRSLFLLAGRALPLTNPWEFLP